MNSIKNSNYCSTININGHVTSLEISSIQIIQCMVVLNEHTVYVCSRRRGYRYFSNFVKFSSIANFVSSWCVVRG